MAESVCRWLKRRLQPLLHAPGRPQEAQAPDVAKDPDQNGDASHAAGVKAQCFGRGAHGRKVVDGPLDDPRDDELQTVDHDQAQQADADLETVFRKIRFDDG